MGAEARGVGLSADPAPLVLCRNLSISVGDGPTRSTPLRNLDLSVDRGTSVAIRGPSGSGKTTLLRVLSGEMMHDQGHITVDGLAPEKARRDPGIGLVYQDFRLVSFLSALENVAIALEIRGMRSRDAVLRSLEMLDSLGVEELAHRLPAEMSGGEQQRIALARTLVARPVLVLADEPTAALDRKTAHSVIATLREATAKHGATLVVATHDEMVASSTEFNYDLVDGALRLATEHVQ